AVRTRECPFAGVDFNAGLLIDVVENRSNIIKHVLAGIWGSRGSASAIWAAPTRATATAGLVIGEVSPIAAAEAATARITSAAANLVGTSGCSDHRSCCHPRANGDVTGKRIHCSASGTEFFGNS